MNNPEIKSLFKYKPLNQFTLDIIANDRIYYPLPESFNDPFDTQCSFKSALAFVQSNSRAEIVNAFPGENLSEMIVHTRKNLNPNITGFKEHLKKFGVLSLAEDSKDILMWSHYAQDHKGVCIEFERAPHNELGNSKSTKKVVYTKRYPTLNPKVLLNNDDRNMSLMRVLYTKSEHWSYEREWRTFKENGNSVFSVPGKILSITFGARSKQMDIDIVKKLVKDKSILLNQAELKENEFGIKLKKIAN